MGHQHTPVQWFPGHMAKAIRQMKVSLAKVDMIAELLDARIPFASRNPELDRFAGNKPRMVILNKADLADEKTTALWLDFFQKKGFTVMRADSRNGNVKNIFEMQAKKAAAGILERYRFKGMAGRSIRVMIAGIPNVGKSSFINRLAGGGKTKVEDRPGVTRGQQWITVSSELEVLDTPGILWPKFEDESVGELLAFTGAVKDQVVDTEDLAVRLLVLLAEKYPKELNERYKIPLDYGEPYELLERIALKRGFLIGGGNADMERTSVMILDEFRGAKIGRISLEKPPEK